MTTPNEFLVTRTQSFPLYPSNRKISTLNGRFHWMTLPADLGLATGFRERSEFPRIHNPPNSDPF